jgi:hypothetical protein
MSETHINLITIKTNKMKTTIIAALVIGFSAIAISAEASYPRHGNRAPVPPPREVVIQPQQNPYYCAPRQNYQSYRRGPNYNQLLRMAYADGIITPRERMILEQNRPNRHPQHCR